MYLRLECSWAHRIPRLHEVGVPLQVHGVVARLTSISACTRQRRAHPQSDPDSGSSRAAAARTDKEVFVSLQRRAIPRIKAFACTPPRRPFGGVSARGVRVACRAPPVARAGLLSVERWEGAAIYRVARGARRTRTESCTAAGRGRRAQRQPSQTRVHDRVEGRPHREMRRAMQSLRRLTGSGSAPRAARLAVKRSRRCCGPDGALAARSDVDEPTCAASGTHARGRAHSAGLVHGAWAAFSAQNVISRFVFKMI